VILRNLDPCRSLPDQLKGQLLPVTDVLEQKHSSETIDHFMDNELRRPKKDIEEVIS
jgi:hypothetical protein